MRLRSPLRMLVPLLLVACSLKPAGAEQLRLQLLGSDGTPLRHAVVYLPQENPSSLSHASSADIDQRDMQFQPHVLAVRTGTLVDFPNSDQVRHHVYSFSEAKRFELPLYKGTPSSPVEFGRPGVVVLGCNIHDHMLGYVLVLDTAVFAMTDEQGWIELEGTDAEEHPPLMLWHPELEQRGGARPVDWDSVRETPNGGRLALDITDQPPSGPAGLGELRRSLQPSFQRGRRHPHGD